MVKYQHQNGEVLMNSVKISIMGTPVKLIVLAVIQSIRALVPSKSRGQRLYKLDYKRFFKLSSSLSREIRVSGFSIVIHTKKTARE